MPRDIPQTRNRAQAYQVFISSTFLDLATERKAVRDALSELNTPLALLGVCLIAVDLQFGADVQPPLDDCLQRIKECDLVVVLHGHRAGSLNTDDRSITECEFDQAISHSIPCLAYVRDSTVPVLPAHIDRNEKQVNALNRLKKKIDSQIKRDTFRNAEHLRGHVLRDVISWILNQPSVEKRLKILSSHSSLYCIKEYLDNIHNGDINKAIDIVTSRRFVIDMRRYGTQTIHHEFLCDLLGLGNLTSTIRVQDPNLRSYLILELLAQFPTSDLASAALYEAISLEGKINNSDYSFHVARAEASFHATCDKALPALKRMLKCARKTGKIHSLAEGQQAVAKYYSARGENKRSRRWFYLSINTVCKMPDICPYCLGMAFLGAAGQELDCHNCRMANDRFLKAYLIGRMIPDLVMQFRALAALSSHLSEHGELEEAVACAVLAAEIARIDQPENEKINLPAILAEMIVQHGRDKISDVLKRINYEAEVILEKLINTHKISDFVEIMELNHGMVCDHL